VKELLFAFKRAASRLNEMRGSQYLEAWRDKHKA
jgi:predicted ATPase